MIECLWDFFKTEIKKSNKSSKIVSMAKVQQKFFFWQPAFQFLFARESQITINYRQIARLRGAVRSARRIINGE